MDTFESGYTVGNASTPSTGLFCLSAFLLSLRTTHQVFNTKYTSIRTSIPIATNNTDVTTGLVDEDENENRNESRGTWGASWPKLILLFVFVFASFDLRLIWIEKKQFFMV